MSVNVVNQIEQIRNEIIKKRKEINELNRQIELLRIDNLDFEIGSLISRSDECPFYESDYEEYIVLLTKDFEVCFVSTSYWHTEYVFSDLEEAKNYVKKDNGKDIVWKIVELNLHTKDLRKNKE